MDSDSNQEAFACVVRYGAVWCGVVSYGAAVCGAVCGVVLQRTCPHYPIAEGVVDVSMPFNNPWR